MRIISEYSHIPEMCLEVEMFNHKGEPRNISSKRAVRPFCRKPAGWRSQTKPVLVWIGFTEYADELPDFISKFDLGSGSDD